MVNSVLTQKIDRDLYLFILLSGLWKWHMVLERTYCYARTWYFKQALYLLCSSLYSWQISCLFFCCCCFNFVHFFYAIFHLCKTESKSAPKSLIFGKRWAPSLLGISLFLDVPCISLWIGWDVCVIILKATICLASHDILHLLLQGEKKKDEQNPLYFPIKVPWVT